MPTQACMMKHLLCEGERGQENLSEENTLVKRKPKEMFM